MKKPEALTFTIEPDEFERARTWINSQKKKLGSNVGTIGDRFSYQFVPTGLGTIIYVIDAESGERECISDTDNW